MALLYDFGYMGALGHEEATYLWIRHIYEVDRLCLKDHNPFFFPMSSTLVFYNFRGKAAHATLDITLVMRAMIITTYQKGMVFLQTEV